MKLQINELMLRKSIGIMAFLLTGKRRFYVPIFLERKFLGNLWSSMIALNRNLGEMENALIVGTHSESIGMYNTISIVRDQMCRLYFGLKNHRSLNDYWLLEISEANVKLVSDIEYRLLHNLLTA